MKFSEFIKEIEQEALEEGPEAVEDLENMKDYFQKQRLISIGLSTSREGLIEDSNGDKSWYQNGLLHREDGPAQIYENGSKLWAINGKYLDCKTQEQFEKLMKLKAFW